MHFFNTQEQNGYTVSVGEYTKAYTVEELMCFAHWDRGFVRRQVILHYQDDYAHYIYSGQYLLDLIDSERIYNDVEHS